MSTVRIGCQASLNMLCSSKKPVFIRKVWADNLIQEIAMIERALPHYPYASMDTEFPGVIFQPKVEMHYSLIPPSLNYSAMKANVDALNLVQVGLTLSDADGNLPSFDNDFSHIWEFNFRDFDIDHDMQNLESISLLKAQGIDFAKNRELGISSKLFGIMLMKSGLVFNRRGLTINWVTFHGAYDFGFLIKILTQRNLPPNLSMFMILLKIYFGGVVFDIKQIIKYCDRLHGGLERVAKSLEVDRVAGKRHQAGSDSLLTMHTFMKLRKLYFHDGKEKHFDHSKLVLYGLQMETER